MTYEKMWEKLRGLVEANAKTRVLTDVAAWQIRCFMRSLEDDEREADLPTCKICGKKAKTLLGGAYRYCGCVSPLPPEFEDGTLFVIQQEARIREICDERIKAARIEIHQFGGLSGGLRIVPGGK